MSRLSVKHVGIAFVVCGVILTASGVGAFSTVTADRQVFVGVGEKSTSYLGISIAETTVTTNGTNDTRDPMTVQFGGTQAGPGTIIGSVTNYFPATLDTVEVTVSGDDAGPPLVLGAHVESVPLKSGSDGKLVATIKCTGVSHATQTVTLEFVAEGRDTHVETKRTVPITCINTTSPGLSNSPKLLSAPQQLTVGSI